MTAKEKKTARYQILLRYALGSVHPDVIKEILDFTNPFKGNKNNRYSNNGWTKSFKIKGRS